MEDEFIRNVLKDESFGTGIAIVAIVVIFMMLALLMLLVCL